MRFFNRVSFQTPESVELDFTLAGIGNRTYALLVDYIVWGFILMIFSIAWSFLSIQLSEVITNLLGSDHQLGLWLFSIWLLIVFSIYVGYFVIFEALWQGQTPGKRYVKIRVIRDDGRPVRLQQATLRALLRPVDDLFCIGLFLIVFSKREKRLGDLVAGTIVIQEERPVTADKFALSESAKAWADYLQKKEASLSQLLPEDFAVIREYLQRRQEMIPRARNELSRQLAEQVRAILEIKQAPQGVSDDIFLEAIYLAYQQYFKRD